MHARRYGLRSKGLESLTNNVANLADGPHHVALTPRCRANSLLLLFFRPLLPRPLLRDLSLLLRLLLRPRSPYESELLELPPLLLLPVLELLVGGPRAIATTPYVGH